MTEPDIKNTKTVLIAEDSITQAQRLKFILERNGFKVSIAADGMAAYNEIVKEKPQLIITDIEMPELNGFELSKKIKSNEKYKHIPVILLTKLSGVEGIFEGLKSGADSFINKPYSEEYLIRHINDVMCNINTNRNQFEDIDLEIMLNGNNFKVQSNPTTMLSLLVSTYESAIIKNQELSNAHSELNELNLKLEEKVFERTASLNEEIIIRKEQAVILEEKNKELEQMTYIASHDLQEPISTIQSFSELMLNDPDIKEIPPKFIQYLQIINNTRERMAAQVFGLLEYSRIGRKNKELTDFNEVIEEAIQSLTSRINESGAVIEYGSLPEIVAYKNDCILLFQNLVGNSIKFCKPDTRPIVKIEALKEEKHWLFSVTDNGIGIEKDQTNKIFTLFHRLHKRDEYPGNGIGLSLCKKIVQMHNGQIWVTSEFGKATTFYFTIKTEL